MDLCTGYVYPLLLVGPWQCGIRSLRDPSTHIHNWKSNPRPSDLESNALSTWRHDLSCYTIVMQGNFSLCRLFTWIFLEFGTMNTNINITSTTCNSKRKHDRQARYLHIHIQPNTTPMSNYLMHGLCWIFPFCTIGKPAASNHLGAIPHCHAWYKKDVKMIPAWMQLYAIAAKITQKKWNHLAQKWHCSVKT